MIAAQTCTLRAPVSDAQGFADTISSRQVDGWTVLSSGFDGISQCWWAIFTKIEHG